ncbi:MULTISPECIES: hypothetical protein [Oscillatoriales]|uniref:hypothetical protein n=1 Tax=Oscillatoriophycideae TaxID=1301283 RepID=UPI0016828817|nr:MULTISPECIES: hypothetical protein [Oscillatoriales]
MAKFDTKSVGILSELKEKSADATLGWDFAKSHGTNCQRLPSALWSRMPKIVPKLSKDVCFI